MSIVEVATTSLLALLMLIGWGWHPVLVAVFWAAATLIEGAFLSSNLAKVGKGSASLVGPPAWQYLLSTGGRAFILACLRVHYWGCQASSATHLCQFCSSGHRGWILAQPAHLFVDT